ncbi:hypothetical protein [Bacillus subtilis]|uniref:hypothetical protein n=1 Tax=Bacillus subtilis TaxID=1423 RepID=UPI001BCF6672|nr:hypothetical protein [Bacillus subtilis]
MEAKKRAEQGRVTRLTLFSPLGFLWQAMGDFIRPPDIGGFVRQRVEWIQKGKAENT